MRLYLVQHGDALGKDVDPERPLSERGRLDVERMARFLNAAGVRIDRVRHSGKLRAGQTAALLAAAVAGDEEAKAQSGLNPNDPVEPVADELASEAADVMLVGHLPFMAKLAARLVAGREEPAVAAFVPASVAALERTEEGGFALIWMIRPDLLEGR